MYPWCYHIGTCIDHLCLESKVCCNSLKYIWCSQSWENISIFTNARCPECKKKLELWGQGDGKIYICTGSNCNFREKASQFEKRFDKNAKVDKREVSNIMKKMQKEAEDFNDNPFADLLKNFK